MGRGHTTPSEGQMGAGGDGGLAQAAEAFGVEADVSRSRAQSCVEGCVQCLGLDVTEQWALVWPPRFHLLPLGLQLPWWPYLFLSAVQAHSSHLSTWRPPVGGVGRMRGCGCWCCPSQVQPVLWGPRGSKREGSRYGAQVRSVLPGRPPSPKGPGVALSPCM